MLVVVQNKAILHTCCTIYNLAHESPSSSPKFGHTGNTLWQLLNVVVEEVEDLHVVQVGHGRRDLRDLVVRQRQPGDVGHLPL